MRKCTVLPVFTVVGPFNKRITKLGLVLVRVIELLNIVVGVGTVLSVGALFLLQRKLATLRLINTKRSSSVYLLVVVVGTTLLVVAF